MSEYKAIIHNKINGLDDILAGDYYIPVIEPPESDDRPIGKWERMHQAYLEEANPLLLIAIIRIGGIQLGEELFQLPKPQKRRKP